MYSEKLKNKIPQHNPQKLGEMQRLFAQCVSVLLVWIYEHDKYAVTLGDAFRDPRVHGNVGEKKSYSSANSVHKDKLAIDLNLFVNDIYQVTTEAHKEIGEFWKTLHPLARWGGDFKNADGNHYSFTYQGRA